MEMRQLIKLIKLRTRLDFPLCPPALMLAAVSQVEYSCVRQKSDITPPYFVHLQRRTIHEK